MRRTNLLLLLLITGLVSAPVPARPSPGGKKPAKNIILLIGDGMGTSAIYAGYTLNHGHLNLERMKNVGFSRTHSTSYITDSGAGGTAIATGKKTYNGAIGVDSAGNPAKTILEWAEEHGKATGLVATCAITHATPASFIAHQAKRGDYELIAADFLKTDIDLFIGGGLNHFRKRRDGIDLTINLLERGYTLAYGMDGVRNARTLPLAALTDTVHPPKWIEGRGDFLPESVSEAIRLLSSDRDGFFLMVEGSQIDWAGHAKDINYLATEMVDFDRAIGVALDFAEKDGETLVIVTADHETGGMAVTGGNLKSGEIRAGFVTGDHTGVMVPVFSSGPHAATFTGIQDNTEIFTKMMSAFGFKINQ